MPRTVKDDFQSSCTRFERIHIHSFSQLFVPWHTTSDEHDVYIFVFGDHLRMLTFCVVFIIVTVIKRKVSITLDSVERIDE